MASKPPATPDTAKNVSEIEAYFDRMEQRTAKGWRPEPGTTMVGTPIALRMGQSDYRSADRPDGRYPIVVYKVRKMFKRDGSAIDHTDTVALHVFHKVLVDRLQELGTEIGGPEQYVTYVGPVDHNTEKNPDGTPKQYHMYDAENVGQADASGKEEGFAWT